MQFVAQQTSQLFLGCHFCFMTETTLTKV